MVPLPNGRRPFGGTRRTEPETRVGTTGTAPFLSVHFGCALPLHKTFRVTPAMEAGLTDHVWELEEMLAA